MNRLQILFNIFCIIILLLFLPVSNSWSSIEKGKEVRIGVLSFRTYENTISKWQSTVDYLNANLPGYRFKLLPMNYTDINPAVKNRTIDFILTNTGHYIELETNEGIKRMVTLVKSENGISLKNFGGVIFTRADRDDINTIADLKGKDFLAVKKSSLGGFLVAWEQFNEQGLDPFSDLASLTYNGLPQDNIVFKVRDKVADAGTVRTGVLENMEREGHISLSDFKILNPKNTKGFPLIHSTKLYPEWPFSRLAHVDDELVEKVTVALLSIKNDSEAALAGHYDRWVPPLDYQSVHDLFTTLNTGPYKKFRSFTFQDVVKKYLLENLIALIIFIIALVFLFRIIQLNRSRKRALTDLRKIQVDLEEQKNLFRQVINELPSPFIVKDYDGKFVLTNKALASLYNVDDPDTMIGKDDGYYLKDVEHAHTFKHNVRSIMDKGETQVVYEDSFDVKTGERRHYMSIKRPFQNLRGEKQVLVITNDITDIRKAQSTLMQYEKIMSVSHDFLSYEDTDYRYQAVNDTYVTAFQLDRKYIIGKQPRDLFGEEFFIEKVKPQFNKALAGKESHYEAWVTVPTQGRRFVSISHHPYTSEKTSKVEGVVTKINDITDRYENQKKLRHLADHDILTGLPNRRMFAERLTEALYRGKRHNRMVAVFFIDLDRFKVINDSLGHSVGDKVLQDISSRMQQRIRVTDTLARSGGDEFLLLLEDFSNVNDVTSICDSLLEELAKPVLHGDHELFVSASIGVSMYPNDANNQEELIQSADAAMYEAKKSGRNNYKLSNEDLRLQASKRFSLEKDLRSALENDEFELYYQPQIEMETQKILGVEVLLRWNHPQEGFISPDKFIPIAEDCGIILPLGEWVLKSACKQMALWLEAGYQLERVAVNVSGNQLLQSSFTEMVKECLVTSRLETRFLELEVTESYLMSDTKMAVKQLQALRAIGVNVAIDDFGTGYSSLRYLQQLPISKLKIDRSFVKDIPVDKGNCAIVKTIIDLAENLEISVIAEGVEEASQEAFLLKEGCLFAQGYKYSKPIDSNNFERLLKS